MNTGVIILAAGSSSRLGRPKQLIEFQEKTLIQRAIDIALKTNARSIVMVLGWNPELIKTGIKTDSVNLVINENWEQGMTTSVQEGLKYFLSGDQEKGFIDQILIMLCDQVKVEEDLLNRLINEKEHSGKGIIACEYSNTLGVPAIFDKKYFEDLLSLKGQEGAKKVIYKNLEDVLTIDFPLGAVDLDTEEDLKKLTD